MKANLDYYLYHEKGYRFADKPFELTRIQQLFLAKAEEIITENSKYSNYGNYKNDLNTKNTNKTKIKQQLKNHNHYNDSAKDKLKQKYKNRVNK